jgi:hypothetical protein
MPTKNSIQFPVGIIEIASTILIGDGCVIMGTTRCANKDEPIDLGSVRPDNEGDPT